MDKIKVFLILSLATVGYYLLLQWSNLETTTIETIAISEDIENFNLNPNKAIDIKDSESLLTMENSSPPITSMELVSVPKTDNQKKFEITNNVLTLTVLGESGAFIKAELMGMKQEMGSQENITLFNYSDGTNYKANTGFFSSEDGYIIPNFNTLSVNAVGNKKTYTLLGESVNFKHTRVITLFDGRYDVLVESYLTPRSNEDFRVTPFSMIERDRSEVESGFMTYAYLGPVFSLASDKYQKMPFDEIEEKSFSEKSINGWVALIQHYFLSAWVPEQNSSYMYQAKQNSDGSFSVGYAGESIDVRAETVKSVQTLFVGPKIPENLNLVHKDLGLAVDYGWLFFLGKPLYWVLNLGYSLFGNWGLSIIFLTISLKLILWPLSAAAYKSMGKMRQLSPKLQELQAIHGSDKQKFSQEMMSLYQKEGVNPLGGCLPMLAQMPFFLAFYWVLIETVELRHAPFFFWIVDLSQKDPFFVLPILNAAGMYYSQTLTPTPPNADPMQAKMMKFMPLVFSAMFCFFPAGLVLYWLINMLVTLVQQLYYLRPSR